MHIKMNDKIKVMIQWSEKQEKAFKGSTITVRWQQQQQLRKAYFLLPNKPEKII